MPLDEPLGRAATRHGLRPNQFCWPVLRQSSLRPGGRPPTGGERVRSKLPSTSACGPLAAPLSRSRQAAGRPALPAPRSRSERSATRPRAAARTQDPCSGISHARLVTAGRMPGHSRDRAAARNGLLRSPGPGRRWSGDRSRWAAPPARDRSDKAARRQLPCQVPTGGPPRIGSGKSTSPATAFRSFIN